MAPRLGRSLASPRARSAFCGAAHPGSPGTRENKAPALWGAEGEDCSCQPCQHSLRLGKLPPALLPWLACLPLNSRLIKMFYLLQYNSISANGFFLVFPNVSKPSFRKLLEREKEGFLPSCICFCRHSISFIVPKYCLPVLRGF